MCSLTSFSLDLGQMEWGFVSNDFTPTQTLQAVSCMEFNIIACN